MAATDTATTILSYQVVGADAAVAANQNIAASYSTVASATANFSADVLTLNPQLAELIEQENAAAAAADTLAAKTDAVAASQDRLNRTGFTNSAFSQRRAFLGLGSILGSAAGGEIPRDIGQAVGLGAAFGAVGVGAGALAAGLHLVTAAEQQATDAAQRYATALNAVAGAIGGGATSADIQKQINDQKLQQQVSLDSRNQLQRIETDYVALIHNVSEGTDEYNTNLKNLNADLYDATAGQLGYKDGLGQSNLALGKAGLSVDSLDNAIKDAQGSADKAGGTIAFLASILDSAAVKANDLAEADKRISDSQVAIAHDSADAMTMTADERRKEIDSIQAHITALEEAKDEYYITGAAADELNAEINGLENRMVAMQDITHSWADTLADVQQRTDAVNNLFDALTKAGEAAQNTAKAQQDLAQAVSDHNDAIHQLRTEEQDKEAQDRAKAAQSAEEDLRQHNLRLADIQKDAYRDEFTAVAERDAVAYAKAQAKAADDTAKEDARYQLQEQSLAEHLAAQLAMDQSNEQKQEVSENQSWQRRQAQLVEALNEAQVEESRAQGLALAYERQANDVQLNERIQHNYDMTSTDQTGYTQQQAAAVDHQNALANIAYAGGALVEQIFQVTMDNLAQIVRNSFVLDALGGAVAPSWFNSAFDARLNQTIHWGGLGGGAGASAG